MKCVGEFVFKSLDKRDAGEFLGQNGQKIKYGESYILKIDEVTENGVFERKLKFPIDNTVLVNKIKTLKTYDKINICCEVAFYNNQVRLVPIDLNLIKQ